MVGSLQRGDVGEVGSDRIEAAGNGLPVIQPHSANSFASSRVVKRLNRAPE